MLLLLLPLLPLQLLLPLLGGGQVVGGAESRRWS